MRIKKSYIIGVAVVVLLAIIIVMGVTKPDPHAGHDHGTTQSTVDPHAGHDHATTTSTTTAADPHAGHSHGTTQSTVDPHAGHDHATSSTTKGNQTTGNGGTKGTTAETQPDKPTGDDLSPDKSYTIKKNPDGTYGITVVGRNGGHLYVNNRLPAKPTCTEISQDVLEIADRSSANPAAHWAVYCDIRNHKVSQTYKYVLAATDNRVAFVDHRTDKFHLFVSDVFDEKEYFKGYELKDAAITSSGSPKVTCKRSGTTLTVTYSTKKGTKTVKIKMFDE